MRPGTLNETASGVRDGDAFALDTSGAVMIPAPPGGFVKPTRWFHLDPFTQGYVEAMLRELAERLDKIFTQQRLYGSDFAKFKLIAPEALAAILKDCAKFEGLNSGRRMTAVEGRKWWARRQTYSKRMSLAASFPPLAPYLGDDGRVYLREARPMTPALAHTVGGEASRSQPCGEASADAEVFAGRSAEDAAVEGDIVLLRMAQALHAGVRDEPFARMDFSDAQWARLEAAYRVAAPKRYDELMAALGEACVGNGLADYDENGEMRFQPPSSAFREEIARLRECLTRNRAALDLIDPMRPLQYATAMDLMRQDMDAAISKATGQ